MIEDLIGIFIKEFQKYNMRGICVLGSWLFNQYVPDSKFFRGFLIRKNKYCCLHVWIAYENKIYDIGNMYNMRTLSLMHLLGPPQYAIEEPIHLEIKGDNQKEFSLQLKHFDPLTYYKNAPQHVKKCIKSFNRQIKKKKTFLDSGIVKPSKFYWKRFFFKKILLEKMNGMMNDNQLTIVKEYEFDNPLIQKIDSIIDKCIRDCQMWI